MKRFTYLGSDIHVSACCEQEVNGCLVHAWGVMDSLEHGVWHCRYLCRRTKVRVFMSLVLLVLLYGCETWTLTRDLRWRFNSFGTRSLQRILGYRGLENTILPPLNTTQPAHRHRAPLFHSNLRANFQLASHLASHLAHQTSPLGPQMPPPHGKNIPTPPRTSASLQFATIQRSAT